MNILRRLLGNNVVISESPAAPVSAAVTAAEALQAQQTREEQMRAELAGADVARITELALTDKRAGLRLLAAQALVDAGAPRATWEEIARTWADKDRRLTRIAKECVAVYERQTQTEARAAALEVAYRTLLDKPSIDLMRLIELDGDADALAKDALKTAPTNDFHTLAEVRAQVEARIETGQTAQRELISIEREADAARLALVAQQAVADPLVHAALADRFAAVNLEGIPAVVIERARKALVALEALTQSAVARGVAEGASRELLARIEALVPEDVEARSALQSDIAAAGLPDDLNSKVGLAFATRTGDAEQIEREAKRQAERALSDADRAQRKAAQAGRAQAEKTARDAETTALTTLISETEAHLAVGEAKAAIKSADAIKRARAAAEHLPGALRARFYAIESEVLKLEGFARDVARKRRAELLERAKKLPDLKLNIDMLKEEVQTLQAEWKKLDADSGGAPRKLWDEFHTATNKAYETVTLYRAVKDAERDEKRKVKETALAEIEALAANAVSETPDWKTIAAKRGQVVRAWYDLGGVGRKDQKALQVRMDAAVKSLDAALDAERAKERNRRQGLIDQVEAARVRAEAERPATLDARDRPWPALADAMQVAQDCQKLWNARPQSPTPSLPLGRKEEQALWEKFRALGNTVFEMRAQAREAVKVQVQAERAADAEREREVRAKADAKRAQERDKWNVLAELDTLLCEAEAQLANSENSANTASPANADNPVNPAGTSTDQIEDADAAARREKIIATAARLDTKHAAHKDLAARIGAAGAGRAFAGAPAAVAEKRRGELLLDLELALNLPAPPGEENARRARQMLLLSNTLKNRGTRAEPRDMLLDFVAQPGAAAPERVSRIASKL